MIAQCKLYIQEHGGASTTQKASGIHLPSDCLVFGTVVTASDMHRLVRPEHCMHRNGRGIGTSTVLCAVREKGKEKVRWSERSE